MRIKALGFVKYRVRDSLRSLGFRLNHSLGFKAKGLHKA